MDLKMTNQFWALLGRHFRLIWPYNLNACFEVDCVTRLLRFTSLFKAQSYDLSSWCMTQDWFETYPDTEDDIGLAPPEMWKVDGSFERIEDLEMSVMSAVDVVAPVSFPVI